MEHIASAIAPSLAAIGGVLTGVLVQRRLAKKDMAKAQDGHLQTFYDTLNTQIKEMDDRYKKEIKNLQDEQREERKQWADERTQLNSKIDTLSTALHSKELEGAELKGQVLILTERLSHYQGSAASA